MQNGKNIFKIWWMLVALLLTGMVQGAFAAKSTTTAVANDKMKEQLRSEVVGAKVFPGEENEYVIGYGDILSVSVYGEGNMAATATTSGPVPGSEGESQVGREPRNTATGGASVRVDGRVSLLHLGDVNVVGMTLTQVTDYLNKLYATVYSKPMVTVALVQSNSRKYTVMGAIRTPGVFNLDYPITVVQAIARSGGFNEWANHNVTVVRAGDGIKTTQGEDGKNTIKFDYDDLVKGNKLEKNIYIKSGDILIVH